MWDKIKNFICIKWRHQYISKDVTWIGYSLGILLFNVAVNDKINKKIFGKSKLHTFWKMSQIYLFIYIDTNNSVLKVPETYYPELFGQISLPKIPW